MPIELHGPPNDPFIGKTFGGLYFIESRIGGGAMGDVYKARHVTLDIPVAIKILKKEVLPGSASQKRVRRFHREARAASRLRHPNVINVTDFGQTEDGTLYMAMEFVDGRSLAAAIAADFPLSEPRIVHIGEQMLSALAEAHANHILHRDLKPENVMLQARRSDADTVKVVDFGIAKNQIPLSGEQGTLTDEGFICGTPGYMSPEQWDSGPLDARSDLYSVGVILYEMLTRRRPFEAQAQITLLRKQLTEKPRPPSEHRPNGFVSPDLEHLVLRALATDREGRPSSAEKMREELLACEIGTPPAQPGIALQQLTTVPLNPSPHFLAGETENLRIGVSPRTTPILDRRTPPRHERPANQIESPSRSSPQSHGRRGWLATAIGLAVLLAGGAVVWTLLRGAPPPKEARPAAPELLIETKAEVVVEERTPNAHEGSPVEATTKEPEGLVHAAPPSAPEGAAHGVSEPAAPKPVKERKKPVRNPKSSPPPDPYESRNKLYSFSLPAVETGYGILSVTGDPPLGDLRVNGLSYGTVPVELLVPAGKYQVRVVHPMFGERTSQVLVRAGTRSGWTARFQTE